MKGPTAPMASERPLRTERKLRLLGLIKEYESLSLKYVDAMGRVRRTIPDLKVVKIDGTTTIVEVKASHFIDRAIPQLAAAQQHAFRNGWRFELWTEAQLGLIKAA